MNKANECTCPSGDGSLVHPCPAHPAVEQASGDERAACNLWIAEQQLCQGSDISLFKLERNGALVSLHDLLRDAYQAGQARAALAQPSQSQYEASFEEWLANELEGEDGQPVPAAVCDITLARRAFNHWPKLEQPAKVGGVRFSAGVSSRLVVEAAQRLYEFESTPEQEAERIERLQAFREQLDPLNLAPHAEAFNEAPDEALRPEQAEAERPEVVGYRIMRAQADRIYQRVDKAAAEYGAGRSALGYMEDIAEAALCLRNRLDDLLAAAPTQAPHSVPKAWLDVQAERRRQITAEGWTPKHDDEHADGQMAQAAGCYALHAGGIGTDWPDGRQNGAALFWPWDKDSWKPTTPRRDLVKACALALAEIERLDRAAATQGGPRDA
ncbi:hypothetical protein L2D71_22755 [Pseudomonas aeruginosa]|uniref:hypothetical protein n=1 Tax=Pseudomonas aeruginosa TaxID=287 RepID=UPI001F2616F4|nr:hypothetical protein [Pseudomonas aeruginosa]MCF3953479.1 hypothetical protein [Pseudomonas aeruginosa]